jgi:hypothetical protein
MSPDARTWEIGATRYGTAYPLISERCDAPVRRSWTTAPCATFSAICAQALEELELASVGANAQHITDEAFTPFTPGSGPPLALTTLRIPGSAVSEASVRLLCDDVAADARFPRLRSLDLASCRALPRDIRRVALETFPRPNVDHLRRALGM